MNEMFDLHDFFFPPLRGPASSEAILAAEARLNIRLPGILHALYAIQNGGLTQKQYFHSPDGRETWLPDGSIHALEALSNFEQEHALADWRDEDEIFFSTFDQAKRERTIIFAKHGWSQWLCLDYTHAAQPGIVEIDMTAYPSPTLTRIAEDAGTFFAGLREEAL